MTFYLSIHISPVFEEILCHLEVVVTGCKVEGRRIPALTVSAVDILLGEQLLNSAQVPFFCRIKQSGVSSEQIQNVLIALLEKEIMV